MELSDARKPMARSAAVRLLRVAILALAVLAAGPASAAMAETPAPAIGGPLDGAVTNNSTPSFSGTTNDATDEVTLAIYAGPTATGTPVQTLTAPPLGETWSLGPSGHLEDGTYTVQATQIDSLLEEGTSPPVTFTVDTIAPTVTLSGPPAWTNEFTPSFSGEAGVAEGDIATVTLKLYAGAAATGAPLQTLEVTPFLSIWFAGPVTHLADGTYTARAEQSDAAGNVGLSSTTTFTVKTAGPAVTLSAPPALMGIATPSFGGGDGVAAGDLAQVKLDIYAGDEPSGIPVQSVEVAPGGDTWTTGPVTALPDGTYTAQAEQSDEALNTSLSAPATFTIDTTAPDLTLTAPAEGSWIDSHSQLVEGAAGMAQGDLPTVTIKLFPGSTIGAHPLETLAVPAVGGAWGATFGGLANGTYTVRAEQSDEAGNTALSASASFTVDTIAPTVSLKAIASLTTDPTPSFSGNAGVASGDLALVRLKIYEGSGVSGNLAQTIEAAPSGSAWSSGPVATLADGLYTAQAEQSDEAGNIGRSAARTFTVKQKGPKVTLTALPATIETTTPIFSGAAGAAPGDLPTVTLKIYAGSGTTGTPKRTLEVSAAGGAWSIGPVAALQPGTYTAQAEQSDEAGNVRVSQPSTFIVAPPVPVTTTTTDSVTTTTTDSLTTSTDSLTTTQSSTRAPETESTATTTTAAAPPAVLLIQPFPIVRIAGADTVRGARLKLLSVQAPAAARITVWCRGHGCPAKPESRIAAVGRAGVVTVEFKRFERTLLAGAVLKVRVSEPGEIGKYTRFQIRHGRLPERLDMCLNPAGVKPIACPS